MSLKKVTYLCSPYKKGFTPKQGVPTILNIIEELKKEWFNTLVVKEERTVKMVDGSACKVISTGTVKATKRNGTMRALEVVRYVPEARYNQISIGVLDSEEFISRCNMKSSWLVKKTG